jgi:adenylate kinase
MSLTDEQETIVDNVVHQARNVYVDAVPGSGKTYTILAIAREMPRTPILNITYSKHLKLDVRKKVKANKLTKLEVHSYHSLGLAYFLDECHNEEMLDKAIQSPCKKPFPNFRLLVIDECQDMTPRYWQFINHVLTFISPDNVLLLGDKDQAIFSYKKADARYLTLAPELWTRYTDFVRLPLTYTHRLTIPIARFVNECMLGVEKIHSNKNGPRVTYIHCDRYKAMDSFSYEFIRRLRKKEIKADDIFVLAHSVREKRTSHLKVFENRLSDNGIRCYVTKDDDGGLNRDCTAGRAVFASYHQSKGRERNIVVVFGFDSFFYKKCKLNDDTPCPNELYVAVTRAREELYLIHDRSNTALPFLNLSPPGIDEYVEFRGSSVAKERDMGQRTMCVTDITRHLTFDDIVDREMKARLRSSFHVIREPTYSIDSPVTVSCDGYKEEVSVFTGLAVPAYWEIQSTRTCYMWKSLIEQEKQLDARVREHLQRVNFPCSTLAEVVHLSIVWHSANDGYHSFLNQITKYDYFDETQLRPCYELCRELLPNLEYEIGIDTEIYNVRLHGKVDAMNEQAAWEFKFTQELTDEHLFQVVVYALLLCRNDKPRPFFIMNMRTGEVRQLQMDVNVMREVVVYLLKKKLEKKPEMNDVTFIEKNRYP